MRILVFHILLLAVNFANAQSLWIDKTSHDFGVVNFWNNDPFVASVKNTSDKTLSFLPIFYHQDYKVWFSHAKLLPGEQGQISIVFYSESKGKFDKKIPVFHSLSGDPILFEIKGQIKDFDPNAMLVCPTVNDGPTYNATKLKIEVRDFDTDQLLNPDHIAMESINGKKLELFSANNYYECLINGGQYRIHSHKIDYQTYDALVDIPSYQKKFVVYLVKKPQEPPIVEVTVENPTVLDTTFIMEETIIAENPVEEINDANEDVMVVEPPSPFTDVLFPEIELVDTTQSSHIHAPTLSTAYRYNNIILVADISTSMKYSGKMESLNQAVDVLVDAMRTQDQIGIVTLASTANIVHQPDFVRYPDSLKGLLSTIKIGGATNGSAALQMAYTLAEAHFVPGGNNQIIIATDGIFSGSGTSNRELINLINQNASKGIYLSTIGLNTTDKGQLFLKNLALQGKGDFIHLHGQENASELLLEMIKQQSIIKN